MRYKVTRHSDLGAGQVKVVDPVVCSWDSCRALKPRCWNLCYQGCMLRSVYALVASTDKVAAVFHVLLKLDGMALATRPKRLYLQRRVRHEASRLPEALRSPRFGRSPNLDSGCPIRCMPISGSAFPMHAMSYLKVCYRCGSCTPLESMCYYNND